jgi:hypothetical protein
MDLFPVQMTAGQHFVNTAGVIQHGAEGCLETTIY